jgi:hypothetical protein
VHRERILKVAPCLLLSFLIRTSPRDFDSAARGKDDIPKGMPCRVMTLRAPSQVGLKLFLEPPAIDNAESSVEALLEVG